MNSRRSTLAILVSAVGRFALPAVGMLLLGALRSVLLSIFTLWRGVPNAIEDMSELWTKEAIRLGWPSNWGPQLKTVFWWLGLATFIVGYILSAYLTVFLVNWLIF
jgi:hypothetical protein